MRILGATRCVHGAGCRIRSRPSASGRTSARWRRTISSGMLLVLDGGHGVTGSVGREVATPAASCDIQHRHGSNPEDRRSRPGAQRSPRRAWPKICILSRRSSGCRGAQTKRGLRPSEGRHQARATGPQQKRRKTARSEQRLLRRLNAPSLTPRTFLADGCGVATLQYGVLVGVCGNR